MTWLVPITKEPCQSFLHQILEIEKLSFPSPWSLDALKSEIKNPISHLWALKADEVLSGYICFWSIYSLFKDRKEAAHGTKSGNQWFWAHWKDGL